MPRPDIEAIRARLDAATPGPWEAFANEQVVQVTGRDMSAYLARATIEPLAPPIIELAMRDATLIAHAPADLAALLAYIAELEGIAREVAKTEPYYSEQPEGWYCTMCDAQLDYIFGETNAQASKRFPHAAYCPITCARALDIPPAP